MPPQEVAQEMEQMFILKINREALDYVNDPSACNFVLY